MGTFEWIKRLIYSLNKNKGNTYQYAISTTMCAIKLENIP